MIIAGFSLLTNCLEVVRWDVVGPAEPQFSSTPDWKAVTALRFPGRLQTTHT